MKKQVVLLIVITVLASLAAACSKPAATAMPTPTTPLKAVPTVAASSGGAAAAPTKAGEKLVATVAPDDTLSLSDREAGLDKLKSYRLRWVAEWKSTEPGKTDAGSWDWQEEYTANPPAVHMVWSTLDKNQPKTEWWQTADAFYLASQDADGKTQCTVISEEGKANDVQKGLFNPSALGSLNGAKYVGTEDVNGVRAKHYKYDQNAGTLTGLGKTSGEIWVAVDGGFVVREIAAWKGGAGLFGLGGSTSQGEGKWTWELSDVNKAISVKPPDSCQSKATGLPIMKDATEKATMGDVITYKSASVLADVTAFYEKEMAAAGYELLDKQAMGEITMLSFEKGDQKVSVMITTDNGKTQVMITVSE